MTIKDIQEEIDLWEDDIFYVYVDEKKFLRRRKASCPRRSRLSLRLSTVWKSGWTFPKRDGSSTGAGAPFSNTRSTA